MTSHERCQERSGRLFRDSAVVIIDRKAALFPNGQAAATVPCSIVQRREGVTSKEERRMPNRFGRPDMSASYSRGRSTSYSP